MEMTVQIINISVAVLLIIIILLQERGTTLGGAFGGEGNVYRGRRGVEKVLFTATIIFAAIFIGTAVVNLFI